MTIFGSETYICANNGKSYTSCQFENAKCDDGTLEKIHDGPCVAGSLYFAIVYL